MDTVLITGVCGGMGSAAAKRLIDEGIKVIGMDVRKSCHVEGIRYYRVDLASGDGLTEALADMTANGIGLSAIVHMSGIYDMNSLIEISEDSFSRIFEVNLFGIYRVNKTFFPLLEPASRIVMVSSELAPLDPLPFTGLYGITKSAVEKYAFSLRMELNLLGHSVIVIRPGAVETGLLNASTAALDKLCENTELYKYNSNRFRNIVNRVENKSVSPLKIADLLWKALKSRRPKYVYSINKNPALRLLSLLPARLQVAIIGGILKTRN